ncbi:MAG: hypothetical protein ACYCUG_14570 [Acidimicrobiales bacterium]
MSEVVGVRVARTVGELGGLLGEGGPLADRWAQAGGPDVRVRHLEAVAARLDTHLDPNGGWSFPSLACSGLLRAPAR